MEEIGFKNTDILSIKAEMFQHHANTGNTDVNSLTHGGLLPQTPASPLASIPPR